MSQETIKPCPFCGGLAETRRYQRMVICPRCLATTSGNLHAEAIAAWNCRTPSELDRLKDAVVEAAKNVNQSLQSIDAAIRAQAKSRRRR